MPIGKPTKRRSECHTEKAQKQNPIDIPIPNQTTNRELKQNAENNDDLNLSLDGLVLLSEDSQLSPISKHHRNGLQIENENEDGDHALTPPHSVGVHLDIGSETDEVRPSSSTPSRSEHFRHPVPPQEMDLDSPRSAALSLAAESDAVTLDFAERSEPRKQRAVHYRHGHGHGQQQPLFHQQYQQQPLFGYTNLQSVMMMNPNSNRTSNRNPNPNPASAPRSPSVSLNESYHSPLSRVQTAASTQFSFPRSRDRDHSVRKSSGFDDFHHFIWSLSPF